MDEVVANGAVEDAVKKGVQVGGEGEEEGLDGGEK